MQKFEYSLETYRDSDANIIAEFLEKNFSIRSVIDIGCGLGGWLHAFQKRGCEILGVDHPYILEEKKIYIDRNFLVGHDLSQGYTSEKKYDLAICLEVAEHLPAASANTLIRSLTQSSDLVLFSAAIPLQGGQGHINEQWPSYWIEKFIGLGFYPDDTIRHEMWNNADIQWWYRQNMLLFRKGELKQKRNLTSYDIVHPELYLTLKNGSESIVQGREGMRLALSILGKTIAKRLALRK